MLQCIRYIYTLVTGGRIMSIIPEADRLFYFISRSRSATAPAESQFNRPHGSLKKNNNIFFLKRNKPVGATSIITHRLFGFFCTRSHAHCTYRAGLCVGFITKRLSAHSCVITTAEMGLPVFFFFNESRSLNLDKNYVSYKNARTKEKEREEMLVCFIGGVGLHAFARSVNAVPNMAPRLVHHITAPNRRRSYIYFKTSFYMLSTYKNRRVFPFLLGFSFSGIYFVLIATGWRPG